MLTDDKVELRTDKRELRSDKMRLEMQLHNKDDTIASVLSEDDEKV